MKEYIISLKPAKGKKLYVDPETCEGVYLYPGEVKALHLQEGQRVREDELEQFRRLYAAPRARKRAIGLLLKKDRTEKELRDKLKMSLNDSRSAEEAVSFVKEAGYVDDRRYARDYLYSKKDKKSYYAIRMELKKKGISSHVIDQLFEREGAQDPDDVKKLVRRYMSRFPEPDEASLRKTLAHFYRKGYDTDLIKEIYAGLSSGL